MTEREALPLDVATFAKACATPPSGDLREWLAARRDEIQLLHVRAYIGARGYEGAPLTGADMLALREILCPLPSGTRMDTPPPPLVPPQPGREVA